MTIRNAVILLGALTPLSFAAAPSVDTLKQTLNQSLLKLLPAGITERNVLFQDVRAGRPNGDLYPFQVTAQVRDYGTGYPANHYYGTTCVGKIEQAVFTLSPDDFGGWKVQGPMTPPSSNCKPNPSAGVPSIPLATLSGAPAPASHGTPSALPTGEWACYGAGGRLLIGLGFRLQAGGTYTNLDNRNKGTYNYQAAAGTIAFSGGHLAGQTGRNYHNHHFDLSSTVGCEPFR